MLLLIRTILASKPWPQISAQLRSSGPPELVKTLLRLCRLETQRPETWRTDIFPLFIPGVVKRILRRRPSCVLLQLTASWPVQLHVFVPAHNMRSCTGQAGRGMKEEGT